MILSTEFSDLTYCIHIPSHFGSTFKSAGFWLSSSLLKLWSHFARGFFEICVGLYNVAALKCADLAKYLLGPRSGPMCFARSLFLWGGIFCIFFYTFLQILVRPWLNLLRWGEECFWCASLRFAAARPALWPSLPCRTLSVEPNWFGVCWLVFWFTPASWKQIQIYSSHSAACMLRKTDLCFSCIA